jgi:hypothetical protein
MVMLIKYLSLKILMELLVSFSLVIPLILFVVLLMSFINFLAFIQLPSTNGVVSLVSTGCPSPEDRCYKHKRKCRSNSFGANVGTLVYSRRTIVVRRKLDFGVASAKPIVDSKPSATTVCKEESDLVS